MQGNRGIPETGAPTGRLVREAIGTFQLSPPCSRVQLHELAQVKPAVEQPGQPTNQGKKDHCCFKPLQFWGVCYATKANCSINFRIWNNLLNVTESQFSHKYLLYWVVLDTKCKSSGPEYVLGGCSHYYLPSYTMQESTFYTLIFLWRKIYWWEKNFL